MAIQATPEIQLNQGLTQRPLMHAPLGSVKDIENFFVTEKGLIKRPGIKYESNFDIPSDYTFLNSHTLTIEGEDCVVYFFYNSSTKTIRAIVKSLEDNGSIDFDINISITDDGFSKIAKSITKGRLVYLGNKQFVFMGDNAYIKSVTISEEDNYLLPPNNYMVVESVDGKTNFNQLTAETGDYLQVQVALLGTPYILIWRIEATGTTNWDIAIQDMIDALLLILNKLSRHLYNEEKFGYNVYKDENTKLSQTLYNTILEHNLAFPDSAEDSSILYGIDSTTTYFKRYIEVRDVTTNEVISFNVTDSSNLIIDVFLDSGYIDLGLMGDGTKIAPDGTTSAYTSDFLITGIIGLEFLGIEVLSSTNAITVYFNQVSSEDILPKKVAGITIEVFAEDGYPKTLWAQSPGIYQEVPIYVSKDVYVTPAKGTEKWKVDVKFGLKQLEFYNYVVFSIDDWTGSYEAQDAYIALIQDPINVAKYILKPIISDSYIKDIYFYQGRVGLLVAEGITFSEPEKYFSFIKRRPELILDTDPIDLVLEGAMMFIAPFDKYLFLLGKHKQYLLTWDGFFSPRTIAVTEVSHYDLKEIRPVNVNNSLYFVSNDGRILEMYTVVHQALPKPFYITDYYFSESIDKLVALPSLSTILGFSADRLTAWSIYVPPIESLEQLYRPISKLSFSVGAEPIGEINEKLYFVVPISSELAFGSIDLSLVRKQIMDQLNTEEFIGIDWYQDQTKPAASLPYTLNYNTLVDTASQYKVWVTYANMPYLIDSINLDDYSLTDAGELTINTSFDDSEVEKYYIGIPYTAFVDVRIPPVTDKGFIPTDKYIIMSTRFLVYGIGLLFKFFKHIKDSTYFAQYTYEGQKIDSDVYNQIDYMTEFVKIRRPMPANGFIRIETTNPDPAILYSYQAYLNIYGRGL